ncbi:uncharacterized protein LOC131976126 [Centropristis striata]|uniref:uncharacterized protein LOC131976126 n=1 Tax=Centropristis striata TaxID=184440 RepID=UPI0027DFC41A|nr:uncharacterized protein LOC131976126 [Centropristis striata]
MEQPGGQTADTVCIGVNYPGPVCGVKGSTVTLPCTFTPATVKDNGREVQLKVTRVVWCQNHRFCEGPVPSVFDSESQNNDSRYKYLGDKSSTCTLQISDLQEEDAKDGRGIFTGTNGVKVTVSDGEQMKIDSSSSETALERGDTVTLRCSARCTFHQLEVTWFRDGHALPETGPALPIGPLTAQHSGNYTCGLKGNELSLSRPFVLQVKERETPTGNSKCDTQLVVRLVLFSLHTVLIITAAAVVIKRTCV